MSAKVMRFRSDMIPALLNTAPGWPPRPIDPSLPYKWQTRRIFSVPVEFRSGDVVLIPHNGGNLVRIIHATRVEELHAILGDDILAEGIYSTRKHWYAMPDGLIEFARLWDTLYHEDGETWESNPLVIVYELEVPE
jgi:hypothetical protein